MMFWKKANFIAAYNLVKLSMPIPFPWHSYKKK